MQGYTKGIPIDTDVTLSANTDFLVSSQKAVKTFVTTAVLNSSLTGGTYLAGTATFTNNTGGTFSVSGFSTGGSGATGPDTYVTGGTYSNGTTVFRNNTGGTFSVSGFSTGSTEVFVTGGTYLAGTATFTNNTGGTFSVSGFSTGTTGLDIYVTGGTYSAGTLTIKNNTGGTFSVSGFSTGSTPTLNQVTTAGNTSSNDIIGLFSSVISQNDTYSKHAQLSSYGDGGKLLLKADTGSVAILQSNNVTGTSKTFELPNVNGTLAASFNGVSADTLGNLTGGFQSVLTQDSVLTQYNEIRAGENIFKIIGGDLSFTAGTNCTFSLDNLEISLTTVNVDISSGSTVFIEPTGLALSSPRLVIQIPSGGPSGHVLTLMNELGVAEWKELPQDITVTGGTYAAGTATFTNNTGGTFSVSGFSTGGTSSGGGVTGVTGTFVDNTNPSNPIITIEDNTFFKFGRNTVSAGTYYIGVNTTGGTSNLDLYADNILTITGGYSTTPSNGSTMSSRSSMCQLYSETSGSSTDFRINGSGSATLQLNGGVIRNLVTSVNGVVANSTGNTQITLNDVASLENNQLIGRKVFYNTTGTTVMLNGDHTYNSGTTSELYVSNTATGLGYQNNTLLSYNSFEAYSGKVKAESTSSLGTSVIEISPTAIKLTPNFGGLGINRVLTDADGTGNAQWATISTAPVVTTGTTSATPTPAFSTDIYALTALATNTVFAAPTGTTINGKKMVIRIKDNGTTRTIGWNAIYRVIGVTLPVATTPNKLIYVGIIYNANETFWDVVAVTEQA